MTVTYSLHVSNARLNGFAKLLVRWRGSIYKLLYREMIIFCCLYYGLLVLYRLVLNESQRGVFEKLAIYCNAFTDLIPLSFVLGFYVTIVVSRWWNQFLAIPWPDKLCMLISAYIHGNDERGRMIRRTLARYMSLLSALTFQAVSTAVKKRFPTLDHLVEAGLMTKEELKVYEDVKMEHGKWWVPAQWFTSLVVRARKEGRIKDDILLKALLEEMHVFRGNCGLLFAFDWISIPLVYTQVVTLAIYTYFIATVMGRQYLDPKKGYPGHDINLYVPVFTILQFFFYMGWLKVAEQLINPFGEDDDDFELNWCLDRNLQLAYNVVDELHANHPKVVKDLHWDDPEPQLPYTRSSFSLRTQPHLGSTVNLDINLDESEFVTMETIMEEDRDENNYSSPPRSPSYDYQNHPSFCLSPDGRPSKISAYTIDGETTSLSTLKLPESIGSRLMNMIMGSNKDISQSSDTVSCKDASHLMSSPFVLKTPCFRKKASSCSEPFINHFIDDKRISEDQAQCLLPSKHTELGSSDEHENHMPTESHNYQEKVDHCTIKVPDLSVVVEESPPASLRGSSHEDLNSSSVQDGVVLQIETDYVQSESQPSSPPSYDSSSSQESLLISSDGSQSTVNSYSELLKHEM